MVTNYDQTHVPTLDRALDSRPTNIKPGHGNQSNLLALLAIGLFLVFDIVSFSLNYLLSWRIEQQSINLNLAGRQRMLSQRMAKALLQIDAARRSGEPVKLYFDELKLTFDLFDNTLRGFDAGYETLGGAGETLFLPALTEPKARQTVGEAVEVWKDYRTKVADLLKVGERADDALLQSVLTLAKERNLNLLDLMNTLTTQLEKQNQQEALWLRIYQALFLVLALACCAGAFVLFRRRGAEVLMAGLRATETAHAERDYVAALVARTMAMLHTAENLPALSRELFKVLATPLGIGCAAFFRNDPASATLTACGHYGLADDMLLPRQIAHDEGLLGQCAREQRRIVLTDPPESHIKVTTALMHAAPKVILLVPVVSNGVVLGVIEMALLHALDVRHDAVLEAILPLLALRIERIEGTLDDLTSKGEK